MVRLYLSSSFAAHEDGGGNLLPLRRDLQARARKLDVEVVLGEQDEAIAAAAARGDHMAILEGCARLMGSCDAFFGMVFQRHGTGIRVAREPVEARAAVSFFEAELLEACVTQKPARVVRLRELAPGASMQEFLRLVGETLGDAIIETDRPGVTAHFDDFCRDLASGSAPKCPWLFDPVSFGRLRRAIGRETRDPMLSFLGGVLRDSGQGDADQTILRAALARVDAGVDDEGRALGQLARLSYLWIAIRELAKTTPELRAHDLGSETQRTLGLWNSSAAWYGLHGAHPMGCLAALNELGHVRRAAGDQALPLGPRASAYYSIGGKMRSKAVAKRFYRQCLMLARRVLAERPRDPSGVLQMTASANAQLALRGEPWRYFQALEEFKRSLDWRERHASGEHAVGEAKAAYGHALFELPWRRKEALQLAAEGSRMIRDQPHGATSGFHFRAERKRADMLARVHRLDEALAVATEARDLAASVQAYDQVSQLQGLIDTLASGLTSAAEMRKNGAPFESR